MSSLSFCSDRKLHQNAPFRSHAQSHCIVTLYLAIYTSSYCLQAAAPVGGLFGGLIAGWLADKLGRKTSIILTSVPYLSGYFIILCAVLAENGVVFKVVLMVGRFLTGVGMGGTFAIIGVRIYIHGP